MERARVRGKVCTSVLFPISISLTEVFSHLMPDMELWAETEYAGATTGVPLLAE